MTRLRFLSFSLAITLILGLPSELNAQFLSHSGGLNLMLQVRDSVQFVIPAEFRDAESILKPVLKRLRKRIGTEQDEDKMIRALNAYFFDELGFRYAEDANGNPPAIGTLYLQKWMLGEKPPQKLLVIVAESNE